LLEYPSKGLRKSDRYTNILLKILLLIALILSLVNTLTLENKADKVVVQALESDLDLYILPVLQDDISWGDMRISKLHERLAVLEASLNIPVAPRTKTILPEDDMSEIVLGFGNVKIHYLAPHTRRTAPSLATLRTKQEMGKRRK
jgi:hypothetical protein